MNCGQIKSGAPAVPSAWPNRLLRIEEELGKKSRYAGKEAFASLGR